MMTQHNPQLINQLLKFLDASPTPFHAVENLSREFQQAGYQALDEATAWQLSPNGRYFLVREGSFIAFQAGERPWHETGIAMVGAHTDSPCLKLKPNPVLQRRGYLQLAVEVYGGALLNPWFDRDLSLAGRVHFTTTQGQTMQRLINFKRPLGSIASLAIHLDREANNSRSINAQNDLAVIIANWDEKTPWPFHDLLIQQLQLEHQLQDIHHILAHELCFYDVQAAAYLGLHQEFLASARLDNLLSCFLAAQALLNAQGSGGKLLVCNDHEEVGSTSHSGAQGPFLKSVLQRACGTLENFYRCASQSSFISVDNAHGIHPNFEHKHDGNHGPVLNGGPVIKVNQNQRYATHGATLGLFQCLCRENQIPLQKFASRNDMACGSTLGPITAAQIGVPTLDIGIPTFAMHSIRELAGTQDVDHLYGALTQFYNTPKT